MVALTITGRKKHYGRWIVRKRLAIVAMMTSLALVGVACGGDGDAGVSPTPGVDLKGGVVRESTTDFGYTNAFDPTGEYLGTAWAWYSNLLIRGLLSYPFLSGEEAGNVPVADLATDTGTLSDDGLSITFTLKDGIEWGPPVSRPITSADVAFAFQRINTESLIAQYGNYYCGTIVGMDCAGKSQDDPISGIETPDDKTITFNLEQPTGDLLYRLAQPAAFPIPPEVGSCFTKAGDYGRFLISSGPYMIQGADELDITSCDTMEPISGYNPDEFKYLVRNPNYDQATDDLRENNPDGYAYTINTNLDDIYNRVQQGDLDLAHGAPPAAILQQYLTNPDLQDNYKSDPGDRTWYITMNLLAPPFDDIAVRKAVNFVVNKDALVQAAGGATTGDVATTIEPPTVLPNSAGYDPYPSGPGDEAAAKEAMKESRYDTDGDGMCDDPVCNNVLMVNRNVEPYTEYTPIMQEALGKIGITLKVRELDTSTAYTTIQTASNLIPIAINAGWGKDYASPYGFDFFLFNTAGLACEGSVNYSNVGMTEDFAKECGPKVVDAYNAAVAANGPIPSVDADMEACVTTPPGDAYNQCWFELDSKLMEEIVPWVPYRWGSQNTVIGDSVVQWNFDQSAGWTAYAHIAVDNGLTMEEVIGA
jgi:peptide/nickel transport system substrate-binding protein